MCNCVITDEKLFGSNRIKYIRWNSCLTQTEIIAQFFIYVQVILYMFVNN